MTVLARLDTRIPPWHLYSKALGCTVENGILNGTADGRLNPQGTDACAHVAAMLARYCETLA